MVPSGVSPATNSFPAQYTFEPGKSRSGLLRGRVTGHDIAGLLTSTPRGKVCEVTRSEKNRDGNSRPRLIISNMIHDYLARWAVVVDEKSPYHSLTWLVLRIPRPVLEKFLIARTR
jgi:hypothetical protein